MPIKSESGTPPPRIGKIGPYTVFVTPPATPNDAASPKPDPPSPVRFEAPVQTPHRVMAPPVHFDKEKPPSFAFFWDTLAKVQNAHASLDEHVAHWFGLNQSKYQWALDDYYATNEKLLESDRGKISYYTRQSTECVMAHIFLFDSGNKPQHFIFPAIHFYVWKYHFTEATDS